MQLILLEFELVMSVFEMNSHVDFGHLSVTEQHILIIMVTVYEEVSSPLGISIMTIKF